MAAEITENNSREANVVVNAAERSQIGRGSPALTLIPPDDSEHDSEEVEDNDIASQYSADAGSIVGVSIGRVQDDMRSPTTPAATKVHVLNAAKSYFEEPEEVEHFTEEPLEQVPSARNYLGVTVAGPKAEPESTPEIPKRATPPARSPAVEDIEHKQQKRSTLVGSILGSTFDKQRTRSNSGSSIVENIRKRFPPLPSISLPRLTSPAQSEYGILGPAGPGLPIGSGQSDNNGQLPSNNVRTVQNHYASPTRHFATTAKFSNFNGTSQLSPASPTPRPLRRATSDQSLYLRREATGSSAFDDYNAFAHVSEMVNSRFKAITDSFQDSSFRRPRILSMKDGDRPSNNRSNSDETKENTRTNAGVSMRVSNAESGNASSTAAVSATSQHPMLKDALSRMTGDLVIMGGYRGSILREASPPHRQLWVPIKVGMNLRKADLEVGLSREDELRMEEKIIADGTLSHIGPVDICRRLIKKCRRCPNAQKGALRIHDYGYDWRLSPDLLSDKLIFFLERLPCNRKELPSQARGAWLVSHSLGGSITRHVINRRPDLVAGVVYAGTPQNCVNILGPLRNGDDVLFSSRVLTAQVNFTLRTSYALLPQDGRCFINKATRERYDVDFFDVKTWEEYRLSPCIRSPAQRPRTEKRTSLIGSLSEAMSQPSKHLSWFTSLANGQSTGADSSEDKSRIRDKAEAVADNVAETAEAAKPERPLSPSMEDGASRSHKPSVATSSNIPTAVATEYLARTLGEVLRFKEDLSHRPFLQNRNAYPPAAVLYAKNTPTVYGAFVDSREDIKYEDAFDDLAFAAGDGVVLASAAQLPVGYRCVRNGRVESDRGHVGLLGDIEGVGKCLRALLDARSRGVGLGASDRKTS